MNHINLKILAILLFVSFLNTSYGQTNSNKSPNKLYDLRELIKNNGKPLNEDQLIIINIQNKQAVFEIQEANTFLLEDIDQKLVKNLKILRNQIGFSDTKYDSIIFLSLKRKARRQLNPIIIDKLMKRLLTGRDHGAFRYRSCSRCG